MTETNAKKTWCPAVRITFIGSAKNEKGNSLILLSTNRGDCNFDTTHEGMTIPKELNCNCIGSKCQKWLWAFIEAPEDIVAKACGNKGFCEGVKAEDLENLEKCNEFLKCLSLYQRYGEKELTEEDNSSQGFCTLGLPG